MSPRLAVVVSPTRPQVMPVTTAPAAMMLVVMVVAAVIAISMLLVATLCFCPYRADTNTAVASPVTTSEIAPMHLR